MKITNTPDNSYPLNPAKSTKKMGKKDNKDANLVQDHFTPSQDSMKKATYNKPNLQVDNNTIQRLKEESERTYLHLREIVKQLLERQGLTFQDVNHPEATIKIDEAARVEAEILIGEGGPLSPEAVSDRIVEFAKAISGGDKSKFETLKAAIDRGFKEAERMLGGSLPEISHRTYAMVMEKLNRWKDEG